MADEPTARAKWNVMMFLNIFVLLVTAYLTWYGLDSEQLTVKEALLLWGGAAFGGGLAWASK